jgi:hypothetical protein
VQSMWIARTPNDPVALVARVGLGVVMFPTDCWGGWRRPGSR